MGEDGWSGLWQLELDVFALVFSFIPEKWLPCPCPFLVPAPTVPVPPAPGSREPDLNSAVFLESRREVTYCSERSQRLLVTHLTH